MEVGGCCWPAVAAGAEEEGSAVRKDGSNSRVFSSVRGTFSASRFCGGCVSEIDNRKGKENARTCLAFGSSASRLAVASLR